MDLALIAASLLFAALALGLTGYGFGLVSMGLLPYVLSVTEANAVVSVLALLVIVAALIPLWRQVRWRVLVPLAGGALAGVPLGVLFLVQLDESLLRMSLGVLILIALAASVVTSVRGRRDAPAAVRARTIRFRPLRTIGVVLVGLVSGAFGGAFSMSGPPVVIYLNERLSGKAEIKASLLAYFALVIGTRVPILAATGVLTVARLALAAWMLPAVAAGLVLGTVLHDRLPTATIRRIIQALLALSAVGLIVGV